MSDENTSEERAQLVRELTLQIAKLCDRKPLDIVATSISLFLADIFSNATASEADAKELTESFFRDATAIIHRGIEKRAAKMHKAAQ